MSSTNLDTVSVEIKVAGQVCDYVTMKLSQSVSTHVPHINDKGLDLPDTYKKYNDPCASTLKSIFNAFIGEGDNKVGLLLKDIPTLASLNLDITRDSDTYRERNGNGVDICLSRYFFLFDNFINSYWRLAYEAEKTKLLVSKFRIDRNEFLIEFNKGDVTNYLNKLGRTRQDIKITEGRGIIQIKVDKAEELTKPVYIKTVAKNPTKYQKLFKRLGSPDLYIVLYVSFRHKDGSITPIPRNGQDTFLIYRYKVDIPHVPLDSRRLLYHKTETRLEQVFISPDSENVWNF